MSKPVGPSILGWSPWRTELELWQVSCQCLLHVVELLMCARLFIPMLMCLVPMLMITPVGNLMTSSCRNMTRLLNLMKCVVLVHVLILATVFTWPNTHPSYPLQYIGWPNHCILSINLVIVWTDLAIASADLAIGSANLGVESCSGRDGRCVVF